MPLCFGFLDLWFDFFPFARTMHDAWTNLMHMLLVFQNLSDLSTVVDSIVQWPMDDKALKSTVEFTLAECFFTKEAWTNSWFVRRHSLNLKRCPQVKRQVSSFTFLCWFAAFLTIFDHRNINTTTWVVWKHILVSNFVLKEILSHFEMFPYLDRCRNNPCLRRTERKWIWVAYQHIQDRPMLSNVEGIFARVVLI